MCVCVPKHLQNIWTNNWCVVGDSGLGVKAAERICHVVRQFAGLTAVILFCLSNACEHTQADVNAYHAHAHMLGWLEHIRTHPCRYA